MTGNLLGEEINPIVDTQIKFRQQIQGAGYLENQSVERSPEVLNYLNNRNSWIKFASGVSISGSAGEEKLRDFFNDEGQDYATNEDIENIMSTGLAENIVLFNTVQRLDKKGEDSEYIRRSGVRNTNQLSDSINKMYGGLGGNSRGLQPVPGITGISIDCLNRGSIKKATVTLKAYNKFQFSLIEVLYLRLGYMMMLEWGWDKYVHNIEEVKGNPPNVTIKNMEDTIIDNQWFSPKRMNQDEVLSLIDGYEARYKGNYGGFFGKVVNFTWKLNADNTYDITVNLITLGSVIESLKVNIPIPTQTQSGLKVLEEEYLRSLGKSYSDLESKEKEDYTDKILANLGSDAITQWIASSVILNNAAKSTQVGNYSAPTNSESPDGTENFYLKQTPTTNQKYVRFGHFLSVLQDLTISGIQNGSAGVTSLELDFDIDTEYVICGYENNLVPLSPNKVIFSINFPGLDSLKSIGRGGRDEPEVFLKEFNTGLARFASSINEVLHGKVLNCYISLTHLADILDSNKDEEGTVTLFNFLEGICNSINESTGGLTAIVPIIKDNKIVTFIDENPIKGYDNIINQGSSYKYTKLEINGYNNTEGTSNFVKNFNVQTKITPDLASMISIGAASNGGNTKDINATPYRKWNEGLVNRYATSYAQSPPPKIKTDAELKAEDEAKFKEAFKQAILNGTADHTIWSRYKFTYNGFNLTGIKGPNVGEFSTKDADSKNLGLMSAGYTVYLNAVKNRESQKSLYAAQNINLKDRLTEAKNNYAYYLANSFGGELAENSLKNLQEQEEARSNLNLAVSAGGLSILAPRLGISLVGAIASKFTETDSKPAPLKGFQVSTYSSKYWDFNSNIQSQGQNSFKLYLNSQNQALAEKLTPVISGTGFIPLELGITMDGISGVNIYNKININTKVLPASYPRALKFLAIGVNHKISGNLWDTELKTISVPVLNNKPPKIVVPPTTFDPVVNVGILADTTSFVDEGFVGDKNLQPIQDLIAKYESRGNYYAKNRGAMRNNKSTTELKGITIKEYLEFASLKQSNPKRLFAIGRYQYTPDTIKTAIKKNLLKENELFTPIVQERLARDYFFTGDKRIYLRNYLLAKNEGNALDLEKAVQSVGQEWASMPVMFFRDSNNNKIKTGSVQTGISDSAYYGSKGNNPSTAKIQVSVVVQALIQSRILMGNTPKYVPIYFSENPNIVNI